MTILLLETATAVCSVALARDGEVLAELHSDQPNAHSSRLPLFVAQLFEQYFRYLGVFYVLFHNDLNNSLVFYFKRSFQIIDLAPHAGVQATVLHLEDEAADNLGVHSHLNIHLLGVSVLESQLLQLCQ